MKKAAHTGLKIEKITIIRIVPQDNAPGKISNNLNSFLSFPFKWKACPALNPGVLI